MTSPFHLFTAGLALLCGALGAAPAPKPGLELVSVRPLWNHASYNSFGDIVRFDGQWYCSVREGLFHLSRAAKDGAPAVVDNGRIRVIRSPDGRSWTPAALIAEDGIDLRDPHISVTAGHRLMIVAGGSRYPNGEYAGRQPRVVFSDDGSTWGRPEAVLGEGEWLWRVTWHDGRAYGVSKYGSAGPEDPANPRRQNLVTSEDGRHWKLVTELKVPGGDETTLRFLPDGRMVALMRVQPLHETGPDRHFDQARHARAVIGVSRAPYQSWTWHQTGGFIGGPNFIVLPDGRMVAGGRWFQDGDPKRPRTALGFMDLKSYTPSLVLPSGGDSSYPGFAYADGLLWVVYYSSHDKKSGTEMYLAKVRVN